MFLLFVVIGYLVIFFILSCCCCKPEEEGDPTCLTIIFIIISGVILLISSILHFVGIVKVKDKYYYEYSKSQLLLSKKIFKNNKKEYLRQVKTIDLLSENMSKSAYKYQISLKSKIQEYNNFQKKDEQYRITFNKIYLNPNTDDYIKNSLKSIDESQESIFSEIKAFSDDYDQFLGYIQTAINDLKEKILITSEKFSQIFIKELLGKFTREDDEDDGEKSYHNDVLMTSFGFVIASLSLAIAVSFPILNFFNISITRNLFFLYPLFAASILLFVFIAGLHIGGYSDIVDYCNRKSYIYSNFEFKEILNANMQKKFENFIEKVNSKNVNVNYLQLESKYPNNIELSKMIQIIRKKGSDLQSIKTMIENIHKYENNIYSSIQKIQSKTDLLLKQNYIESNEVDASFCNDMILGCNITMVGSIFLCIGFILMSISVCLRRPTLKKHEPVGNSYGYRSDTPDPYTRDIGVTEMFYVEYLENPRSAKREEYFHEKSGCYGYCYYVSDTYVKALEYWVETHYSYYSDIKWSKIMMVKCTVNMGRCYMDPDFNPYNFKNHGKEDMEEENCQTYYDTHSNAYGVFDKNRIQVKSYETVDVQILVNVLHRYNKID